MTISAPREVTTPHRQIPLEIPDGIAPTEFFNSPCNLRHLARENGLLRTPEGFLLYRKAIGHSNLFDTSQKVLDPMGRPVRRDQLSREENIVFSRMTWYSRGFSIFTALFLLWLPQKTTEFLPTPPFQTELRNRLVKYNLGTPIATRSWPAGRFVPPT